MTAAALTYSSLLTDVLTYAERSDAPFTSQLPRFVMLAENRIATECRGLGFQRFVTTNLATSTLQKPARWRETIGISIVVAGEITYLKERSYEYCRSYAPTPAVTGVPEYFANYTYEHLLIAPTPNTTYTAEIAYYERPEPLSEQNQTNWTTQYAPQLLLYATLLEAAPFLKRPDLMQLWQGLYEQAKNGLAGEAARRSQDKVTTGDGE